MSSAFRRDEHGIFRCAAFDQFEWQQHGFGSSAGNPNVDVTLRQIHSIVVWNAEGLADREQEGDAIVTDLLNRTIGVRTADCVPILLLDSRTHAVAAVHAGWRGTAARIAGATIASLASHFGTAPGHLYAAVGPCIRACCYEVGVEVASQFVPFFPEWPATLGRRTIDLPETNRRQMQESGIPENQIFDSGLCTVCSSEPLFSFRREPNNPGRMLAAITRLS